MLRKTILFALLPAILGFAPFQQAFARNVLTPGQSTLVDATCNSIMGLRKGEDYYPKCQDTLAQSLARKAAARTMAAANEICLARGLAKGSPALSVCMLQAEDGASAAPAGPPVSLVQADDTLESGRSFYDVTPTVQWRRERYSCAQLGLTPGGDAFADCVVGLQGAFLPDD